MGLGWARCGAVRWLGVLWLGFGVGGVQVGRVWSGTLMVEMIC